MKKINPNPDGGNDPLVHDWYKLIRNYVKNPVDEQVKV
jgi:hypothetical protein